MAHSSSNFKIPNHIILGTTLFPPTPVALGDDGGESFASANNDNALQLGIVCDFKALEARLMARGQQVQLEGQGAGAAEQEEVSTDHGSEPVAHGESIQITNLEMLAAIFGKNIPQGCGVAVCSLPGNPKSGQGWPAQRMTQYVVLPDDHNNYVAPSSFLLDSREKVQALKSLAQQVHFVMLDDVATKFPLSRLAKLPPTWLLESSAGNYQAGYVFDEPISVNDADAILNSIIEAGLCDPDAKGGATRWARLPNGVNGKLEHLSADRKPFQCRLVEWRKDAKFTPDQIIDGLGLRKIKKSETANENAREKKQTSVDHVSTDLAKIQSALDAINPNGLTYNEWLHVGFALSNADIKESESLWYSWSARHQNDDPAEDAQKWKSFQRNEGRDEKVTLATLFHMAAQRGWKPPEQVKRESAEKAKADAIAGYISTAVSCGENEDRARKHAMVTFSRKRNHHLYPTLRLLFDTSRQVSVADVLAEPTKYVGQCLADPLSIFYGGEQLSGQATCAVDQITGDVTIHSELNGGTSYTLRHDDVTLNSLIRNSLADTEAGKQGLIASFIRAMVMGGAENPILTPTQKESLVKKVSAKSGSGIQAIKSELKQAQDARPEDAPREQTNYPEDDRELVWPDVDQKGEPQQTLHNVEAAFNYLGIKFWFNELAGAPMCDLSGLMHDPRFVEELKGIEDHALRSRLSKGGVRLTDAVVRIIHRTIRNALGPYLGRENISELAKTFAEFTLRNPFIEEISSYVWDGVPRLDTWLPVYFGAEDTPLNRQIGQKTLLAAVMRNLEPGCKYDQMAILEGPQGIGKSRGLKKLGGAYYVSGRVLTLENPQKRIEGTRNRVLVEEEEMAGHSKADQDQIKSNLSRTVDQVRMAYAEFDSEYPIRCIFIGTTNRRGDYLADETGARRFWPVWCSEVRLDDLKRDRDQLWAEAYSRARAGESIILPQELWPAAAEEAAKRRTINPWEDVIQGRENYLLQEITARKIDAHKVELRVTSYNVLLTVCDLRPEQHGKNSKRVAEAMRALGWEGPSVMRFDGKPDRGYRKIVDGAVIRGHELKGLPKTHTWQEYCDHMDEDGVPF